MGLSWWSEVRRIYGWRHAARSAAFPVRVGGEGEDLRIDNFAICPHAGNPIGNSGALGQTGDLSFVTPDISICGNLVNLTVLSLVSHAGFLVFPGPTQLDGAGNGSA